MGFFVLGLLNGLIVPLILGLPSKTNFLIVPKPDGFSSFSNVAATKLNPNGATVRQWETRTWITTIPISKIDFKSNPLEAVKHLPSAIAAASTADDRFAPSLVDPEDPFLKSYSSKYNSSSKYPDEVSDDDSYEGEPVGKKLTSSGSCYGEGCRKSSYQGSSYDSTNHFSPEIKSLPQYPEEPDYSKTSVYHHSSSSDDHSESDGQSHDDIEGPTLTKSGIAWARLHPVEIRSEHYKGGSFRPGLPTEESDWWARRKSVSSDPSIGEPYSGHSPSVEVTEEPYRVTKEPRPKRKSKGSRNRSYPVEIYNPTYARFASKSYGREEEHKSLKKFTYPRSSSRVKSDSRDDEVHKWRTLEDHYHHFHPIEDSSSGRDSEMDSHYNQPMGDERDEKGHSSEPTNLSGHYSSHEMKQNLDPEHRVYRLGGKKSSLRQLDCHCLKPAIQKSEQTETSEEEMTNKKRAAK